jgi:hypothetical protein
MVSGCSEESLNIILTLCEDGIDQENQERAERSGSNKDPDKVPKQYPGQKSTPLVGIERSRTSYREPLEADLEPLPEPIRGGQKLFLGRPMGHLGQMREMQVSRD